MLQKTTGLNVLLLRNPCLKFKPWISQNHSPHLQDTIGFITGVSNLSTNISPNQWMIHRVSIEWKSPYKESYTVNSHRKSFDYVLSDVRACVRFQNGGYFTQFLYFFTRCLLCNKINNATYAFEYKRILKHQSGQKIV